MLLLFALHIFITISCSLCGFLFYHFIRDKDAQKKPLIFYSFTGLIFITLISQTASLFIPVNYYFFLTFFLLVIPIAILKKKHVSFFVKNIIITVKTMPATGAGLVIITWLLILVLTSGPTMMDDTESYHIQMIKWINEYGTVPGIANLHERFGFNSSWFSSVSFFLPFTNNYNLYTSLNGVISLWLSVFLISQLGPILDLNKNQKISSSNISITVVFLLMLFCWPMIRGNATTSNYDFITTALILILFIKTFQAGKQTESLYFEWIIWPVYLFTVRITNCPLLFLSLYSFYFLVKNKEWKRIILYSLICFLLFSPFIVRNILLSGYPFYPATVLNIFKVDWKVDGGTVKRLLEYIKYFNRVNSMYLDINQTRQSGFPDWTILWFRYLFYYDKPVVTIGILGYLLNLVFVKRFFRLFDAHTRFLVLVLCTQFILWMWIAPDPRFAYGGLLCGVILLIDFFLRDRSYLTGKLKPGYFLIIFFAGIFLYASLKTAKNKNYQNFILPYRIPQPPTKIVMVDSLTLRIPEKILNNWNPRCYATQLPCLYVLNPKLRARGKTIRYGFRLEK